jgi:hypothetical protein
MVVLSPIDRTFAPTQVRETPNPSVWLQVGIESKNRAGAMVIV